MKKLIYTTTLLLASVCVSAQEHTTYFCGQTTAREKLFQQHPGAEEASRLHNEELEAYTAEYVANRGGEDPIYIIPVVFHIIHQGGAENISDAQVQDAVNILSRDFRKQNADTVDIVDEFVDIAADTRIEFRLATKDPEGNCHSGINRISSALTMEGYNPDMKALSVWPRNQYLNIWVCNTIGGNTAGFTNLPGDVAGPWGADEDGIVILYNYTGSIEESSESRSRTLTHEVGHWLNLYHVWGPGNSPGEASNCFQSDLVDDTPATIGHTSCPLGSSSDCGDWVDNIQNYLEYSFCYKMFTWGQRQRMRAALNSVTAQRNQLWSNTNLIATGVINPPLCEAIFTASMQTACVGEGIQFNDVSYHGITSWNWNFGDGNTLSGNDPLVYKNPVHIYETPGVYNISLTVGNGTSTESVTNNSFLTVLDSGMLSSPLIEGFENAYPGNTWLGVNYQGDETWEITPSASFSGDKSLKLRNFSIDSGNIDELYTATFDMEGVDTIYLSYKWSYANRVTTTDDKLRIMVSGDCGNSWVVRKLRKGTTNLPTATATNSQFTPATEADWDGETLVLTNPDWFTDRFRVRFEFSSLGGNNFYLDDINIVSSTPTGIKETTPLFIYHVYPNPSSGDMTIEVGQLNGEDVSIELYSATGQLCSTLFNGTLSSGQHSFNIPDQATGIYNLVLKKSGHIAVQKVIFE
jgi:PKD repeat protein